MKICYSRPSSKGFPCSVDLSEILHTLGAKNRSALLAAGDRQRSVRKMSTAPSGSRGVSKNGIELSDVRQRGDNGPHCADDVESVLDDAMRERGRERGGGGDTEPDCSDTSFSAENLHVSDSLDDGLEWYVPGVAIMMCYMLCCDELS